MPSSLVTARDSSIKETALAGAPESSGYISSGDTSSLVKELQKASQDDGWCLRKSEWDQRYLSNPPLLWPPSEALPKSVP